jgi:hypothetical protein
MATPDIKSIALLQQYLDTQKDIPLLVKKRIMEFAWGIGLEATMLSKNKC